MNPFVIASTILFSVTLCFGLAAMCPYWHPPRNRLLFTLLYPVIAFRRNERIHHFYHLSYAEQQHERALGIDPFSLIRRGYL